MVLWDDSYNQGLQYVDNQHRCLFVSLDTVGESLKSGKDVHESSCNLLYGLLMHFTIEASLLEAYWFDDQERHRTDHELMLKTLWQMLQDMRCGRRAASTELLDFLGGWLVMHVKGHEALFANYLEMCGGVPEA